MIYEQGLTIFEVRSKSRLTLTIMLILLFVCVSFVLVPGAVLAQDEPLDGLMDGFDDDTTPTGQSDKSVGKEHPGKKEPGQKPATGLASIFSLDGYFKIASSYAYAHDAPEPGMTDWRGFNRLQTEARAELKAKFSNSYQLLVSGAAFYDFAYRIKGRDEFTDQVLDDQEKEYELRDTYFLATPIKSLDIKLGRQIVVWGKSDNIRITDILNPMDLREPGITDIENLRLPVTMARVDYYIGDFSITGIAIPEIRFNKLPPFGGEYNAVPFDIEEVKPEHGINNMEYAAALNAIFSKWEFSLYWADFYRDNPHVVFENLAVRFKHARLTMYGAAANVVIGSWLFKAETAYFDGFKYMTSIPPNMPPYTLKTFSKVDVLGGIEYMGFADTMIGLDGYNSRTLDYDESLEDFPNFLSKDEGQFALRITRSFLNDTLDIIILILTLGEEGLAMRYSAEYDIIDALSISGGVLIYKSDEENSMYANFGENDRAFLELKYSF